MGGSAGGGFTHDAAVEAAPRLVDGHIGRARIRGRGGVGVGRGLPRHVWTPEKLQAWLTDPEALVPGQAMGYRLSEAADRRDVVAFLQSLATGQPAR